MLLNMFTGRGTKREDSKEGLLLILLITFKLGEEWTFFASMLKKLIYVGKNVE